MPSRTDSHLVDAIERLNTAAACLPSCDRAAKLRGLIKCLEWAVADGSDVMQPIITLVRASRLALDDDPWVQVNRLAQDLERELQSEADARPRT